MVRIMRRDKQQLTKTDTETVMNRGTNGVLACYGDDGYPYAVPLSYVYHNGNIYFHCAQTGHKISAIINNPKVSFAVVDDAKVVSKEFTIYYRSVIAFGRARITEGDERTTALEAMIAKFAGDQPEEEKRKRAGCVKAHIVAIDIEQMTGKEHLEYAKAKENKS
jgi:hypothetical protein